jgi:hypothetical protein
LASRNLSNGNPVSRSKYWSDRFAPVSDWSVALLPIGSKLAGHCSSASFFGKPTKIHVREAVID